MPLRDILQPTALNSFRPLMASFYGFFFLLLFCFKAATRHERSGPARGEKGALRNETKKKEK